MGDEFRFIKRSEILPEGKDSDICAQCRARGLNLCDLDEFCQLRLAQALGKGGEEVSEALELARGEGLVDVRSVRARGKRPKKFVRITDRGSFLFGILGRR